MKILSICSTSVGEGVENCFIQCKKNVMSSMGIEPQITRLWYENITSISWHNIHLSPRSIFWCYSSILKAIFTYTLYVCPTIVRDIWRCFCPSVRPFQFLCVLLLPNDKMELPQTFTNDLSTCIDGCGGRSFSCSYLSLNYRTVCFVFVFFKYCVPNSL